MGDEKSSLVSMASRDSRDRELLIPVADHLANDDDDDLVSKASSSSSSAPNHSSGCEVHFLLVFGQKSGFFFFIFLVGFLMG